jgi:Carboxypeptidase regulatory-like domain
MAERRLVSFFLLLGSLLGAAGSATEAPAGLIVHVVDREGRPVPAATVHAGLQLEEVGDPERTAWLEKTAADGTVRLTGLPLHEVAWLLVEQKGFSPTLRGVKPETRDVRLELRPVGIAVGRVVDEAGHPVAGAEVEIKGTPFDLWTDLFPAFVRDLATRKARTGPAGRFRFRDLPEGEFELSIRHPSFAVLQGDHPIEGSRGGDLGRFVLRRGEALRGLVTDTEGRPLAGLPLWAVTEATEQAGSPPPSVTTGPDGTFEIPHLPPGQIDLFSCGPGYRQVQIVVRFFDEPLHLTLEPAATLRGRVLGPDGRPLAGVNLHSEQDGSTTLGCGTLWTPCAPDSTAFSDAEGRFEIGPLAPSWYNLRAQKDGLQTAVLPKLRAPAGVPVEGIEIRLQKESGEKKDNPAEEEDPRSPMWGRVLGPDGAPIERALVYPGSGGETWTLADGSFELQLPPGEETDLWVSKTGFALHQSQVHPDTVPAGGLEIRLEHGGTVTGRVLGLNPEERSRRIEVQLTGTDGPALSTSLRSDATFQFDHVAPGAWDLRVSTSARFAETSLVLAPEPAEVAVEIEMAPTYTVAGQVLDALAAPVAGADIHAMNEERTVDVWSSTRLDGRFSLLLPDGEYEILIHKKGHRGSDITVQVDGGPEEGLEIRLAPSTSLRGRLIGLAPGEVPWLLAKGRGTQWGEVEIDHYSITDLEPGAWTIEATLAGELAEKRSFRWTVEIPSGDTDIDLDLDLAAAEEVP